MDIKEKLVQFFKKKEKLKDCIVMECSCKYTTTEQFLIKLKENLYRLGYKRITCSNGNHLFYCMKPEEEDLSVVELLSSKAFNALNIEDEIGSMGDELARNGVTWEENTSKRRIAVIIVADTETKAIQDQIYDATYEYPIGIPMDSLYQLAVCACVDPSINRLYVSSRAKILTKQWQMLVDEVLRIINS